jgi:hypothetical protein
MTDIPYGPHLPKWDESKMAVLVEYFNKTLEYLRAKDEVHFERAEPPASKTGFIPYVGYTFIPEEGVIIGNITRSAMEDENRLRAALDEVYNFVMGQQ